MRRSRRIANRSAGPAAGFTDLPNPIVCDILSRLPLNSIFACKRVCKNWRDLISIDPYFSKLHLSRSPLSLISYFSANIIDGSPAYFEISQLYDPLVSGHPISAIRLKTDIHFPRMRIQIVASCNGLILLSNESNNLAIVCNPLRAQHLILPKPLKPNPPKGYGYVGFGIGHSTVTNQYKVLRYTITHRPTRLVNFDIYAIGSDDEWRSLGGVARPPVFGGSSLVFLNGALHWIGFKDSCLICYFDIEKEQFGSFPLPSHIGDAFSSLGVVDNWLYIRNERYALRKFWLMKDYGDFGSWLKCVLPETFPDGVHTFVVKPLKFLTDGSLLMSHHEYANRRYKKGPKEDKITLASYNPCTGVLKKNNHCGITVRDTPYSFVPCFFSPMDALEGRR